MASPGSMAEGWVPQKPNNNAVLDTQATFQDYSPSPATSRPQATSKWQPCWGPAPRRLPLPALEGSLGPADSGLPGPARLGKVRPGPARPGQGSGGAPQHGAAPGMMKAVRFVGSTRSAPLQVAGEHLRRWWCGIEKGHHLRHEAASSGRNYEARPGERAACHCFSVSYAGFLSFGG